MNKVKIAKDKWNKQADQYNQWSELDLDEKMKWIFGENIEIQLTEDELEEL